ncbi:MAG TPA: hypothetical protein VJ865_00970 [Gemmatimonadaceae bacterium]|nr:hypothetical protein [Gemmatimonadaceae bacterium]
MTKSLHQWLLVFAVLSLGSSVPTAGAQTPTDVRARLSVPDSAHTQILTLVDGSKIFGRVESVSADSVTFLTQAGRLQLAIAQIKDVRTVSATDSNAREDWFPNPNATRLFFAPTGQMLKQGEGYFSDYEVFFPGIAYGVTDNLTIGGGFSLFPAGLEDQVYYFTPKVGISVNDRVHVATGLLLVGTPGGTGGIYYGVATFGDGNGSVTVGGGYGFAGGKIESKPVGMIGGERRIAKRLGIVTENYLLPVSDNNFLYSLGLRFIGENITTDLALANVSGSDIIGIPYVDFVFRF